MPGEGFISRAALRASEGVKRAGVICPRSDAIDGLRWQKHQTPGLEDALDFGRDFGVTGAVFDV